ncbi:hypothetical protein K439DRAFT_1312725, partial [Ramaria rubella]
RDEAAIKLQRAWRSHRKQRTLDTEARWQDAILHAKIKARAHDGRNGPKERWRRAAVMAARLQDGRGVVMQRDGDGVVRGKTATDKHLETQHWLELVDG